eukprot:GHVO01068964.1.p1 GENE.GHVO01068964.1~~GHVO01068964.1.p1  ORF type:complete len:157 (+),score=14.67 GHVO01068964.1:65-535(+)
MNPHSNSIRWVAKKLAPPTAESVMDKNPVDHDNAEPQNVNPHSNSISKKAAKKRAKKLAAQTAERSVECVPIMARREDQHLEEAPPKIETSEATIKIETAATRPKSKKLKKKSWQIGKYSQKAKSHTESLLPGHQLSSCSTFVGSDEGPLLDSGLL